MKPSLRENLDHLYGVHSKAARDERRLAAARLVHRNLIDSAVSRLRMLDAYEDAERVPAEVTRQFQAAHERLAYLRSLYVEGQIHGFGYGFVFGILAGAAGVAGLLMLGIKVGP